MKTAQAFMIVFITIPIRLFLYYKVLQLVNATELMWFLFWVYVPFCLVTGIISNLAFGEKK